MRLRERDLLRIDRVGSAVIFAAAAGLTAFALTPELSGALLTAYLVAAPVIAIGLIAAWRRERVARRRQFRETWALLHANLQLRETAQALLQEARHDPLTGLDNRRAWHEKIEREGLAPRATAARQPSSCWTSTTSRPSTTASATTRATPSSWA